MELPYEQQQVLIKSLLQQLELIRLKEQALIKQIKQLQSNQIHILSGQ